MHRVVRIQRTATGPASGGPQRGASRVACDPEYENTNRKAPKGARAQNLDHSLISLKVVCWMLRGSRLSCSVCAPLGHCNARDITDGGLPKTVDLPVPRHSNGSERDLAFPRLPYDSLDGSATLLRWWASRALRGMVGDLDVDR